MVFVNDQDRFCSMSKLPLFSYPMNNRVYETTPGLATPPVNIAGSVPFLWEEAPGKPRRVKKPARLNQKGVVRSLDLPPRLLLPGESTAVNEPSPTTVLDGPYDLRRRSLSLPRSAAVIRKLRGVPAPAPEKEQRLLGGSNRWGSFAKCKEVSEGIFDFSRFRDDGFDCRRDWTGGGGGVGNFAGDGGTKVKLYRIIKKGSFFNLSHTTKSDFWARVYEGFKQVIPWKRKQENLERTNSSIV
ncbi:hypothetical protein ISN45_Aa08g015940 [Arabidopsis thaliana x Arabidopsis arenosa]|uniref:Uncharacterized protein n=1 Tax=Arabidopsis thaliana x Arabidopsis arenosa TaxID=1240361 RepID=A0A8T1XHD6_9BRAS|nr:hypothetical protein ISN45_Aa08g015940 [Arabidopsis thaliana x Arabidopsis arenosa]